jgi:hypothetical protein
MGRQCSRAYREVHTRESVGWIQLAQDVVQLWNFMKTVMNIKVQRQLAISSKGLRQW